MRDLAQATLAVVPASAAHEHAMETIPETTSLVPCETLEDGIGGLLDGRVDAVGTGNLSAIHHASLHPDLAIVDVHGLRNPEYLSFPMRPNSALQKALNAFIAVYAGDYCHA